MKKAFLLIACLLISLNAQDIRIASYNVENLFDGKNDGTEYKDFRLDRAWSKQKSRLKFARILKVLVNLDADIVALQEVENKDTLAKLARKSGFRYAFFTKPAKSPVGVGLLSRYRIIKQGSVYAGIEKTRDFLYARLDIKGKKLGLWVVHFPTQKYPYKKRLKVAKTLKKAIQKARDREFLILGDFNTKLSSSSILQKTFGFLDSKDAFYDPWYSLPHKKRYSHVFYGRKSALDRALLGKALFDGKGFEYKEGSFRAFKDGLSDDKGYPKRFKKGGYSDHFPIVLSLTDKPQKSASRKLSIKELYALKDGKVDVRLEKVALVYKTKKGLIFGDKQRGIYAFKAPKRLKKAHLYDVRILGLKTYKGLKEISALEVLKEHGKVRNLASYFKLCTDKLRPSDVLNSINGKMENSYLVGDFGRIKVYNKSKKHLGNEVEFREVRVGFYKGELELVLEDRE